METRANHVWVGAVSLLILGALALFVVWIVRLGQGDQKDYDIFFKQSVEGLAKGSQVSFAGVPVGQVKEIRLWEADPEFVRVRIAVKDEVPVLVGTTATIQSSFTGVSTILLDGARKGRPAITCETTACPEDVPVIPPKAGGFGQILANAPLLLERLATLTERLTELLSDKNQASIAGILENTDKMTESFAAASPQIESTLAELQVTLREASETLDSFQKVTDSTDKLLNEQGGELAAQLKQTLDSAGKAAQSLQATLDETQPAARKINEETIPAATAAIKDLQATSKALRQVTERIESEGAGSLIGSEKLPDYDPK